MPTKVINWGRPEEAKWGICIEKFLDFPIWWGGVGGEHQVKNEECEWKLKKGKKKRKAHMADNWKTVEN